MQLSLDHSLTWPDDDDTLDIEESLKRTLQNVGSISLQVTWVSVINPGYYSDKDIIRDNSSVGTIPEKALKGRAVSHQARSVKHCVSSHLLTS